MVRMYLDDIREPKTNFDVIVRSSQEALEYVQKNGCPDYISFDHDLGEIDTAMNFIKWLVQEDINKNIIPEHFRFNVHSANPVGAANIEGYLKCYLRTRSVK